MMRAEILSWSRSRGLFAGVSLEGATMRPDTKENNKLPRATRPMVALLNGYSGGSNPPASHISTDSLSKRGGRVLLSEGEIHFTTNQSAVPAEGEAVLYDLARKLNDHPAWKARVKGYTDNVGSKGANQNLSTHATAVMTWLIDMALLEAV